MIVAGGVTRTLDLAPLWARYRPVVAVMGVVVAAGQVIPWALAGGWPFHDSIAFWQAGRHVLAGVNPYAGDPVFLAFRYAPPWAVALAPLSLLDPYVFTALLLLAQLAALRWLAGSWTTFGLWGWLPFVPRELATGNVDILMAAAIYAGVARMRNGSAAAVWFALAKFSPVLAVTRWREAAIFGAVCLAVTLPVLYLWPMWVQGLLRTPSLDVWLPLWFRLPIAGALLLTRKPWAVAAAAGIATPAFYYHSLVLLLAAWQLRASPPTARGGPDTP